VKVRSREHFGHSGNVEVRSRQQFGHSGNVKVHSREHFEHSGNVKVHSREHFGHSGNVKVHSREVYVFLGNVFKSRSLSFWGCLVGDACSAFILPLAQSVVWAEGGGAARAAKHGSLHIRPILLAAIIQSDLSN
jgi:hypothetical protein